MTKKQLKTYFKDFEKEELIEKCIYLQSCIQEIAKAFEEN